MGVLVAVLDALHQVVDQIDALACLRLNVVQQLRLVLFRLLFNWHRLCVSRLFLFLLLFQLHLTDNSDGITELVHILRIYELQLLDHDPVLALSGHH